MHYTALSCLSPGPPPQKINLYTIALGLIICRIHMCISWRSLKKDKLSRRVFPGPRGWGPEPRWLERLLGWLTETKNLDEFPGRRGAAVAKRGDKNTFSEVLYILDFRELRNFLFRHIFAEKTKTTRKCLKNIFRPNLYYRVYISANWFLGGQHIEKADLNVPSL